MEVNLQHEDLLIKLRAKLNVEKIKLWEPPYIAPDDGTSQSLRDLAAKYSAELSQDNETVLQALLELQVHSLDRSKENAEFKETGTATFRVKATVPGEKPRIIKVVKKLDALGSEMFSVIAAELDVVESRIKLIYNGKVLKPNLTLAEQGLKNGVQVMALIMAETPEEIKEEDKMYLEMKRTRDDAMLLSEQFDDIAEDDDYMKLEDQWGNAVELPVAERRALLVGLALHERGRALAKQRQHPAALVLLLEADAVLSECRSSLLEQTDNVGVLQLDIAWCYLSLGAAPPDAAARLQRADDHFRRTYGGNRERLIALKGNNASERVLFMRLYLLQGIVAYHQNRREEARELLERAEAEMNTLRVDSAAVTTLVELGWSADMARAGLRAAAGDPAAAHHYLARRRDERAQRRDLQRAEREHRALGLCDGGGPVSRAALQSLRSAGHARGPALRALRAANNDVDEATRILLEHPELLGDTDGSSDDTESPSSAESLVDPDTKLVAELEAMGYATEDAKLALSKSRNHISGAVDILVAAGGHVTSAEDPCNPSTSTGAAPKSHRKHTKDKKRAKRQEREQALRRLTAALAHDEDEYLDTSLIEEEDFLAKYKSLL